MPSLLCPQWVFDDYTDVTADFLCEHGVKLLLSDLDFTLAPKKQKEPDAALKPVYDRNYRVFRQLYASNKKNFALLNRLKEA